LLPIGLVGTVMNTLVGAVMVAGRNLICSNYTNPLR
jgi:hypothetical protein